MDPDVHSSEPLHRPPQCTVSNIGDLLSVGYSVNFSQSPTAGYLHLADIFLGWDTFKVAWICYSCGIYFVIRKLVHLYYTKETCSTVGLCPCSVIMGQSRYSSAFRIILEINVVWSLDSNIPLTPEETWQFFLYYSGGATILSLEFVTVELMSIIYGIFLEGSPSMWWIYGCKKQQVCSKLREKRMALCFKRIPWMKIKVEGLDLPPHSIFGWRVGEYLVAFKSFSESYPQLWSLG